MFHVTVRNSACQERRRSLEVSHTDRCFITSSSTLCWIYII